MIFIHFRFVLETGLVALQDSFLLVLGGTFVVKSTVPTTHDAIMSGWLNLRRQRSIHLLVSKIVFISFIIFKILFNVLISTWETHVRASMNIQGLMLLVVFVWRALALLRKV